MPHIESEKTGVTQAGEKLFNFAVDREDVKVFIENLPEGRKCRPVAVEYELQLLKIIATGWSISFFLENNPRRAQLAENFWKLMYGFSANISETTRLLAGHDIDYFQILKSRLDMYVAALTEKPEMAEPAAVIGPAFAKLCGDIEDVYTVMAGSKMFIITVAQVKDYLEFIERESLL